MKTVVPQGAVSSNLTTSAKQYPSSSVVEQRLDKPLVASSTLASGTKHFALVSLVVEVLFCKQGVVVRFHPGAPLLTRIRLAAIPLGLGPRFRRFESYMRDHF